MTIDKYIAHARDIAAIYRNNDKLNKTLGANSPYYKTDCIKCAEEHEQLAEWLEELKAIKSDGFTDNLLDMGFTKGYNKAIDDFVKEICKMIVQSENNGNYRFYAVEIKQSIADLAEQLKAGKDNANKN